LANCSLYTSVVYDAGEFAKCRPYTSRLGLFIDMRRQNNGKMFFVVDGEVQGLMFSSLRAPVYPGFSAMEKCLVCIQHYSVIPNDWMNLSDRIEDSGYNKDIHALVLRENKVNL
jgi:hypothetical protein